MSRCSLVLLAVLAIAPGARAREPKPGADGLRQPDMTAVARVADVLPADQTDLQRRRDILRQATRVQMQEAPTPARQLSAQERAELRQQLQQQRLELLK